MQGKFGKRGKLIEIEREVSPNYEAAALCVELEHKGRPIFFHAVDGTHKVVMNVLGGRGILAELFGVP
ncbi:MAG: UbiD family decarboxylase, partial [Euryarchaeota archaeon]|nr:UbiD family decarboxylase [Euryarchaeota archaeon]